MAFVEFETFEPYGKVVVNPGQIFSFAPEAQTPADDTELFADGDRAILVAEPVVQVAAKLGLDFRRFTAASTAPHEVYVNRNLVLHLLPHPQVDGVCFVHGLKRRIAVVGTVDEVAQALN